MSHRETERRTDPDCHGEIQEFIVRVVISTQLVDKFGKESFIGINGACLLQKFLILSKRSSVELVFDFVPQITETQDRLSKSETIDAEIRGCVPAPKPMVPGTFLVDGPPTPSHRHSA